MVSSNETSFIFYLSRFSDVCLAMCPENESWLFHLAPPAGRISSLYLWNISISTRLIDTKCCTDIHITQRMNPNYFGDPLSFPLVPSWGWHSWFWVKQLVDGLPWNLVQVPLRINCNKFGDHFISHIRPKFDQMPAKLKTFPLALAVLCV